MSGAAIALGSNLGDRLGALRDAVESLRGLGDVATVSSLYETAPVGGPEQGRFLNAVVILDTELNPASLLARLQEIEAGAGRVRRERWGPRPLDLDIVTMVDEEGAVMTHATRTLVLPHPRAPVRRFVVEPLAEVWPNAPLGSGQTASGALPGVADQDVRIAARSWLSPASSMGFVAGQAAMLLLNVVALLATGSPPGDVTTPVLGGLAVAVAGATVSLWASRSLGEALTPFPEPKPGTEVVVGGPYHWVRHPIYLGVTLFLVGSGVVFSSVEGVAVAIATGVFFWFKSGYEESRLRLVDPSYDGYAARVRGRLLPYPGRSPD